MHLQCHTSPSVHSWLPGDKRIGQNGNCFFQSSCMKISASGFCTDTQESKKSSSVVAGVIRSTIELGNLSRRLEIRCSVSNCVRLELLKVTVYIRINLCRRKSTLGVFRPQWHLQAEQASSTPLLLIANSTFTLGNQTKRGRLTMQTIKTKLLYILRNPGFQAAVDFSCTWWHLRRNVRCWKVHPIPSVPTVGRSCHFQDSHLCLAAVLLGKFREIRLWGKHLISF